jgi:glycosyltransferase involved in cell wall biosynthesis
MKILFILELYYPNIGGNERLFRSLAEALVSKGHEVNVLTTRFRKDLPKHELVNGVRIRRLPVRSRFVFTFLAICPAICLSGKADLIHTTSYNAAFPAWLAARITRRKVVITFHEVWGKLWFRLPYLNAIQKRLFYSFEQFILHLKFDRFIAVSEYTRECLEQNKVHPRHILRIYNGLDYAGFQKYNPGAPSRFTFTYFGRPGSSKGLDILVEAVPAFINEHPGARLKLIMSRSPERAYRKITGTLQEKLGKESFTVLNDLDDEALIRELLNSSCILIPSYSEGFCYAAAESIALGIPLVHSNLGALKEVVSGKHIPMGSQDPPGLFHALEKAINNEWEEKPLRKFELSETVNAYIRLYESFFS